MTDKTQSEALAAELRRRAAARLRNGDLPGTLRALDEMLRLNPGDSTTLYNKGAVLIQMRRFGQAQECFAQVLRRQPDHAKALQGLEYVREAAPAPAPDDLPAPAATARDTPPLQAGVREWQSGDVVAGLYEVVSLLGHGGMGAVYRVQHRQWNIDLAVKCPRPEIVAEVGVERFTREAETWVSLGKHPNVATAFYVRTLEGLPRIFVELVEGGSLAQWIRAGRLRRLARAVDIAIQICDGVIHAHARDLVHRDLKPDNCLMTPEAVPKITDFGLVKRRADDAAALGIPIQDRQTEAEVWQTMTGAGAGMGTPHYMPPEQWSAAADVGPSADVYAFGVMLYELFCGRRPFVLDQPDLRPAHVVLRRMHMDRPPPDPQGLRADLPDQAAQLMLRCLAKAPDQRYQDFESIREVLTKVYESVAGRSYFRERPSELDLRADDLNNRALSLLDLGRTEEAWDCLAEALATDPLSLAANLNRAVVGWEQALASRPAIRSRLQVARETYPHSPLPASYTGAMHFRWGEFQEALATADDAIALDRNLAQAWNVRGAASWALGRGEDALQAFRQASSLESGNDDFAFNVSLAESGAPEESETPPAAEARARTEEAEPWQVVLGCEWRDRSGPVAYTPDGELVTVEPKRGIYLSDPAVGEESSLGRLGTEVGALAMAPAGGAVWVGRFGGLFERRIPGAEEGMRVDGLADVVTAIAVAPDGEHVAWATGGTIHLARLPSGEVIRIWQGHAGRIKRLAFWPEGDRLVSAGADNALRVWDLRETEPVSECAVSGVSDVAWLYDDVDLRADRDLALVRGEDGKIWVWDLNEMRNLAAWEGHSTSATAVALFPSGRYAVSGDTSGEAKIWEVATGREIRSWPAHSGPITALAVGPTEENVATQTTKGGVVRNWHLEWRAPAERPRCRCDLLLSEVRSTEQETRIRAEFDAIVQEAEADAAVGDYGRAYARLRQALALPGGPQEEECLARVYQLGSMYGTRTRLRSARERTRISLDYVPRAIAFSPDGDLVATGGHGELVELWRAADGEWVATLPGHQRGVLSIAFTPDGSCVLAGGARGAVRLCDVTTGEWVRSFRSHDGPVRLVAVSPDGSVVVSGGADGIIAVSEVASGVVLGHSRLTDDRPTCLALGAEGAGLVVGTEAGNIAQYAWRRSVLVPATVPGRALRLLRVIGVEHMPALASRDLTPTGGGPVAALGTSPDGTVALSVHTTGTLLSWPEGRAATLTSGSASEAYIPCARVLSDNRFVLAAGPQTGLIVHGTDGGHEPLALVGHRGEVRCLDASGDERFVVSGGEDKTIRIWELDWDWSFPGHVSDPGGDDD